MTSLILLACILFVSPLVQSQPIWISGAALSDQPGTYNNSLGKANVLGSRAQSVCWGVHNSEAWVFGGNGYGNTSTIPIDGETVVLGPLNDLWTFTGATDVWFYVSGAVTPRAQGQYGPLGEVFPGARRGSIHWRANGLFYLFGGSGISTGIEAEEGILRDIWAYNPVNKTWQVIDGTQTINALPQYTTDPLTGAVPNPGSRQGSASWVVHKDGNATLWLFGGSGGEETYYADLWSYNASGVWNYHNILNSPSARTGSASWVGPDGNLYLFGGQEIGIEITTSKNDIWYLNTTSLLWTLVVPLPHAILPSPRYGTSFTHDSLGNLWLFGGISGVVVEEGPATSSNDLWTYNTTGQYWDWVLGTSTNSPGVYDPVNRTGVPASRGYGCLWIDELDKLYLFGGTNSSAAEEEEGTGGYRNDLWKLYDIVIPKPPTTTTGNPNVTTTGDLTTGASNVTTGSQTITTGGSPTTGSGPVITTGQLSITTGAPSNTTGVSTGPATHPVSPAVISGTIMGGSVAITLGITGIYLYRRRKLREAEEANELLPLNRKPEVNH